LSGTSGECIILPLTFCTTTTTTTTTTSAPTTTTTSTTTTTTTGTTTSTTTTTTTTVGNCGEVNVSGADLSDATGNTLYLNGTIYVEYFNTSGVLVQDTFSTAELFYVCGSSSGTSPDIFYYKNNVLITPVDSSFTFLASTCTEPLGCYTVYEHFLGYSGESIFYIPDCCSASAAWYFNSCWNDVTVTVSAIGNIRWFDCNEVENITYIGTVGAYALVGCVRYDSVDNGVPVPLQPATITSVDYGNSNCNI
jgi:hypothetical protein